MKITTNGTFPLATITSTVDKTVIYVSGNAGGGTITVGYTDDYNTFVPLTDGILAVGSQGVFTHGLGINLSVRVAGATAPAISIRAAGVK